MKLWRWCEEGGGWDVGNCFDPTGEMVWEGMWDCSWKSVRECVGGAKWKSVGGCSSDGRSWRGGSALIPATNTLLLPNTKYTFVCQIRNTLLNFACLGWSHLNTPITLLLLFGHLCRSFLCHSPDGRHIVMCNKKTAKICTYCCP